MLKQKAFVPFTSKEITPKGWLYDQLRIQANGLSGHLDKIWPDVRDSRWIGGECDGWERVPYWLDGFIPLAYLLRDEDMISRAKKYVDAIFSQQKSDGWICPCEDNERDHYDMWALILIGKVLVLYYECSGDERVEPALYQAFRQYYDFIKGHTLFNWGLYRWFEALIPIYWLYEKCNEAWLLDLAVVMYAQGADYRKLIENCQDQQPKNSWSYSTHVVNFAMAYKAEALVSLMSYGKMDGDELAQKLYDTLMEYHGMAVGHFTGDECLSGNSPIQGTELCGVAEAMFSFETIFSIGGKTKWIDRLEQLAYNAFPATTSPDMWTHQYVQQTNQIECSWIGEKGLFRTNNRDAHLFGLEPNFGCCTANFNQAWPKFALSTFMREGNTIVSASLAPAEVTTKINGIEVNVELQTLYPFRDTLKYVVKCASEVEFTLGIRIPGFVKSATVEGKSALVGEIFYITRVWEGETSVDVAFSMDFELVKRPEDMYALRRGPLFYSVAIDEEWRMEEYERNGVERVFPYCDYEIFPKSKWNYAFAAENFKVEPHDDFDMPFSTKNPPVSVKAIMKEIDWGFEEGHNNVCARVPKSRKPVGESVEVKLIPYGCSSLRMTEMPKVF